MTKSSDVVVVGAGVVGTSIAYYLASLGIKVTIVEREAVGSGASAHATGSLSLLGTEYTQGPSFRLGLAGYAEFKDLVPRLEEETGIDLMFQRRPSLRLALDAGEEQLVKEMMPWQKEFISMEWITGDDVRRIEPRLSSKILGAAYEEESAQLDSYNLNLALAVAAEKKGVQILLREITGFMTKGSKVLGVETERSNIPCDIVVIAAGIWSKSLGRRLGICVPVEPLKGERILLRYDGAPLPVLISSPKRGHMISRLDGLLSVGSTGGRDYDKQELFLGEDFDRQTTETAKIELINRAVDVLPEVEGAQLVQQLAGSRPLSPDRLPIIGPVSGWEGILLATGHTTKGIHLGPITGKVIVDYVTSGRPDMPFSMDCFLPDRFSDFGGSDIVYSSRHVEE